MPGSCSPKGRRLGCAALLLGSALSPGCGLRPAADGEIVVRPAVWRSKELLLHEIGTFRRIDYAFQIRNGSKTPCELRVTGKSCGCVELRLFPDNLDLSRGTRFCLRPGQRKRVVLAARVRAEPGLQSYSVSFVAQGPDGGRRKLALRLLVPVTPELVADPPVIAHDFVDERRRSVEKKILISRNIRGDAFSQAPTILGTPPEVSVLSVEGPKIDQRADRGIRTETWVATVRLTLTERVRSSLAGWMTVGFEGDPTARLRIPVTIRRRYGVVASSTSIDFGAVGRGGRRSRRVLLACADDRPFDLLSTRCSPPCFQAESRGFAGNRKYWLDVSFNPTRPGDYEGKVIVATTHPGAQGITIQVRGLSR